jgi:PAS domain S-box-containing protein
VGTSLAAEPLLSLAVTVTSEQRVESVLQRIVQGLASEPGVALARIWLLPSADLSGFGPAVSDSPDFLCLVASAGTPINSPGEDWSFLHGHFARVPFNVGKVGQVAAIRDPILVKDVAAENDWVVRPEWAKREEIRSFAGHPLIFRDKLLGVIGVFSRKPLGQQEFTWLGLFANQAAVAIANARAFEEVERLRRDLRSIINTIPTTAWTTRPDGYCDFINQVWLDYAGMTAEKALGWGWAEAIHPDDRTKLVEDWQSCLASGRPVDTEARIRRLDGSYRWFLIRANPLRDESGNILKWYGTCIDIDDHKRVEQTLRASEFSWRQIVDNIPGLVATMGVLGEVEFLNRQILEYFGKTNEELKNWSLIGVVHPDDLPRVIEARAKSIETEQLYEVEHRCRGADGVYRWFQVRGLPVRDRENKISAWYLLLTDIDDRKRAEEALQSNERNLRLIINAVPTLIHVLRTDGSVLYVNQALLDYTGLTLEDAQKEDYRARVVHPEDVARLREERREALTRAVPFENEQRLLGKDGGYRWFLVRYNPMVDEGRVTRWYASATEIESRKREEDRVRQENVRLEERTRIARELHDTLLQTVQGASLHLSAALFGIAEDSPVKPRLERILQLMSQGIEEGRNAIQGLRSSDSDSSEDLIFAFSRIRHELEVSPEIDFRVIVTGREKQLPAQIQNEIYRIGREALVNAFNHSGAKRVELELEYSDSELRMRIRDNGCGIDPEVLEKGLDGHWGLASMRERATRLGGLVKVLSSPTVGTEVQLSFPSSIPLELSPSHRKSA